MTGHLGSSWRTRPRPNEGDDGPGPLQRTLSGRRWRPSQEEEGHVREGLSQCEGGPVEKEGAKRPRVLAQLVKKMQYLVSGGRRRPTGRNSEGRPLWLQEMAHPTSAR